MLEPRLKVPTGYTPQTAYNEIHKILLLSKISHYRTKVFAAHEAFGKAYDQIADLIDTITEKLIGYSDVDPSSLTIGTVNQMEVKELGMYIIKEAKKLEDFAEEKEYCDIENLAQELSGIGAQLKFLSRYK